MTLYEFFEALDEARIDTGWIKFECHAVNEDHVDRIVDIAKDCELEVEVDHGRIVVRP